MTWHAQLALNYSLQAGKTSVHFTHDGPLRILKSLYPEGPAICHNVLVHPPGGLVGGDVLDIDVHVAEGAHALVTTPGATRFYKSNGQQAMQRTRLRLDPGARLEWLPLEAIAYNACDAVNQLEFDLAEDAQLLTWDVTALGLPLADHPYTCGRFEQHIEWPGRFLERGVIDAQDELLLNGDLGLAGHRCLGSLIFASGSAMARHQREALLEGTQELLAKAAPAVLSGVTAPNENMLVLRCASPVVEPVMMLWKTVWGFWRKELWGLQGSTPRIWSM
ncbi:MULTISPECIES: urease accessory protein UreD [Comamonas]|uniref:urease accessory protein UreD n=1 Tax=Comamonas TaxID=283 RepID=UPI000621A79A|nr:MULTISPECIES: urease accessory protein UreD [Comamonas]KKI13469.1 urease accessory protein ureD [Comamonas thiooxydans]TYK77297.1 urease accessory protein UreD [Comamonas sp. Z1]BCX50934.1 urease accessory protein UreD [Comamonas testosteroni]